MIKVSVQAKSEVTKLMSAEGYNVSSDYVRVGVKSGGCSGLSYDLNFDNSINTDDKVYEEFFILNRYYFRIFWWIKWQGICF